MKFISKCIEFETDNRQHLIDTLSENSISNKNDILEYLKSGSDDGVLCSSVFDYVISRSTGDTVHCYTDGEYFWDDREIYHFEKYNMKLDDEFVNHILKNKIAS